MSDAFPSASTRRDSQVAANNVKAANAKPGPEPIPADARQMVAYTGLAYVATVCADGLPNVSPKGSLKVLDEHTLVFGDIASPGTMANLAERPHVEVNVMDVFRRRGYRFRGRTEILQDPGLIEFVGAGIGEQYPISSVVKITVEETRPLISPIYWVTDATEKDVVGKWEEILGYYRRSEDRASARPLNQDREGAVTTETAAEVERLAESYGQAWNDHNLDAIVSMHTNDMAFQLHLPGYSEVRGEAALRAHFALLFRLWPDLEFRTERLTTCQGLFTNEMTMSGTLAEPMPVAWGSIEPTGERVSFDAVDVIPVEEGRVKRKDTYIDAGGLLQQLALLG